MARTAPLQIEFDNFSRDQIREKLEKIQYPETGFQRYVDKIKELHNDKSLRSILAPLLPFLDKSISYVDRPSSIKLLNLPFDSDLLMPPSDNVNLKRIEKNSSLSENLLTLIATLFGQPYSMHYEGRGLINNLVPSRATSKQITGLGATSDLRFHTENVALRFNTEHDCSPAALFLTGVRQDVRSPKTRLSDARLALELLGEADKIQLAGRNYKIKLPFRWRPHMSESFHEHSPMVPLTEWTADGLVVHAAFYGDMIADVRSPDAERAAKNFEAALEEVALDEVVVPGEMLGIDNNFTLHARTPFDATFDLDGRAMRWVQRVFITDTLDRFDSWKAMDECVYAPADLRYAAAS